MKSVCSTCISYSPEYQGWRTEFFNYCKLKKKQIQLDYFCDDWKAADQNEMQIREKIWKFWDILERSVNR